MSNWISITIETLYEARIAALVDACSTAALGDGQPDRVTGLIQGVIDEIRRKIGSCANNQVDADLTTIPKGLRDMAVDLIIARLKGSLEIELTEDERATVRRHSQDLNRIAECKDAVEQPDSAIPAEVQSTTGSPRSEARCFRLSPRQQEGV